jgi:sugar transferase (PEP-CTERM/EpsH1 system associated)
MRIAFVSARVPYPLNTGGRIRTFHLLKAVAEVHEVTLITAVETDEEAASLEALHDALPAVQTQVARVPPRGTFGRRVRRALASPFDPLPFAWAGFRHRRFIENVAAALGNNHFDLVHCDQIQVAHALPAVRDAPRLIDAHNVEHVLLQRLADNEGRLWRRALLQWQARKTRETERATYAAVDHCIAVSEIDRTRIQALAPGLRVSVVPNGVDVKTFAARQRTRDDNLIVFVGSMDWPPNVEGVAWFVRDVLPHIQGVRPAARFLVVGRRPAPALVRALGGAQVQFTGTVDDVRPFVEQAAIVAVPLLSGGGTRLKILEAWAMAKAVVSTTVGAEGLPIVPGANVMLGDDPRAFAQCVTQLLDDAQAIDRLGAEGRKVVEEQFAWERVAQSLFAAYTATVSSGGRVRRES